MKRLVLVLLVGCGGGASVDAAANGGSTSPAEEVAPDRPGDLPGSPTADPADAATDSPALGAAAPPSCGGALGTAGVATCGPEGGRESCCRSLTLPRTKARALDRYEITSGRLRAFVAAVPDVRAFAKAHAAAHPDSQLALVATKFDGLLDVLPTAGAKGEPSLAVHLGATVMDPINALDGCHVAPDAYGHATYWQEESALAPFGVPKRKYAREVLDAKPVNCVMPLLLATFCAWDGGELARTSDYHEIWGAARAKIGDENVSIPWASLLRVGDFNWRNGHGKACPLAWPGCESPQPYFFHSPAADHVPSADDTPAIAEPGRFAKDVTAPKDGWFDVAGNLMEAAWPNGALETGNDPVENVCDVTAPRTGGDLTCKRQTRTGVRRFAGALPHVALVGYSFEGHARRSESYLGSADGDERRIAPGDAKPVTFQYGKLGGRCARPAP